MKKLLSLTLLFISICTYAQTEDWVTIAGTNVSNNTAYTNAACNYDIWGNVIMGGTLANAGQVDSIPLAAGAHLVKMNRHGDVVWTRKLNAVQTIAEIKTDHLGNILFAGKGVNNQAYFAKYNSGGSLLWELVGGGLSNVSEGLDIDLDANGSLYIVGIFQQTLVLGNKTVYGGTCLAKPFVGKVSPAGNVLWLNTSSGGYCFRADKVHFSKRDKHIYVAGVARNFSYQNLFVPDNGTFGYKLYIMEMDSNGTALKVVWNSHPDSDGEVPGEFDEDDAGNMYFSGFSSRGFKMDTVETNTRPHDFLLKLDTGLHVIWAKYNNYQGSYSAYGIQLAIEKNKVMMVGVGGSAVIFGNDTVTRGYGSYIAMFDTSGAFITSVMPRTITYYEKMQTDKNGSLAISGDCGSSPSYISTWGLDSVRRQWEAFGCETFRLPQMQITGEVYYDYNGNGVKDAIDWPIHNVVVYDSVSGNTVLTDDNGKYKLFVEAGQHAIKIVPVQYSTVSYPVSGSYVLNDTANIFYYNNRNFGVKPIPNISDLWVDATAVTQFRPGFQAGIVLTAGNKGTDTLNATVQYIVPSFCTVGATSIAPSYQSGDTLRWQLNSLKPYEQRNIGIGVSVDLLTPFGTAQTTAATIIPVVGDTVPSDNTDSLKVTVTSSFDPNFKEVLPEGDITTEFLNDDSLLQYVVHFQNTGNDTAIFVVLLDTLDIAKLDIRSLQFISSSHPCVMRILDSKIIEFTFENIYLPDSNVNEAASHGFAKFSVKAKQGLAVNTEIKNNAAIFFDYNEPVITNRTNTRIVSYAVGISETDAALSYFPNPTTGELTVLLGAERTDADVTVYNLMGAVMARHKFRETTDLKFTLPETSGMYIVRVSTTKHESLLKVLKH